MKEGGGVWMKIENVWGRPTLFHVNLRLGYRKVETEREILRRGGGQSQNYFHYYFNRNPVKPVQFCVNGFGGLLHKNITTGNLGNFKRA